jgi:hypothetical protein
MTCNIRVTCFLALAFIASVNADEPRYVTENGVTYRETREVERRPTAETRWEERTQTVYKTEFVTELREQTQTVWVPITEYTYEPHNENWWNLLAEPKITYQLRPVTRWEPRTQTQRVPVTVQKVVPETKIVQAPVRTLGFAEHEYVQRLVVKGPPAFNPRNPVGIAQQNELPANSGGLARPGSTPAMPNTVRR